MKRLRIHVIGRSYFKQTTEVHNADAIRNILDHRQIVSNEKIRQAFLFLQIFKQVDNLGLDGNVQSRNWFIGNDEARFNGQSTRNADTLTLTAREFMRITAGMILVQADRFQQFFNFGTTFFLCLDQTVNIQTFCNDVFNRHTRIERSIGILENHLHVTAEFKMIFF